MNKTKFLEMLHTERAAWERELAKVTKAQMIESGAVGKYSVKDIVAHITWFEREMLDMLQTRVLDASNLWELPPAQRNEAIYKENRQRSLQDVLEKAKVVFQQLVAALETLTDEDLLDPQQFKGMPLDWVPWKIIADNSYKHYRHHLEDIRVWSMRRLMAQLNRPHRRL